MENEDRETLKHISETLDAILEVLSKPQSRLKRILEIAITSVTLFGFLSVIDIVKGWIGG